MKILLANNFHYIRGGAERAYFDLAKILTKRGHEVAFFSSLHEKNQETKWSKYFIKARDLNKDYGFFTSLKIGFSYLYNFSAKKNMEKLIKDFKPDVIHLHNIHYLSPSIIDAAKKHNVPVVMTLHDYKPICPERTMYVRGKIWEKSKGGKFYKCFFDRCIKDSYFKSFGGALEAYLHKVLKIYEKVDAYISPSKFLADKFKEFGFKNNILNIPNPLLEASFNFEKENKYSNYLLYFGRLTEEKGIDDLIKAFSKISGNIKLLIVGDGPQKEELIKISNKANVSKKIVFIPRKSGAELWTLVKDAKAVIFPSKWYENYPYSVLEPMSLTKVLICAKVGGIPEMVEDNKTGLIYESGNISSLKEKIEYVLENEEKIKEMGENAKEIIRTRNSQEEYYKKLIEIYNNIIIIK